MQVIDFLIDNAIQPQPRKRGRPLKRDDAHYQNVWDMFTSIADSFAKRHGRQHKSIRELLEVYFTELILEKGLRVMRVNSPEFRGRLRTLENEICVARKRRNALHGNSTFSVKGACVQLGGIDGQSFLVHNKGDSGFDIQPVPERIDL